MSKFDPYKPPMSLQESDGLLKAAEQHELNRFTWNGVWETFQFWGMVLGVPTVIGLALWLGTAMIGANATGLIALVIIFIWLARRGG